VAAPAKLSEADVKRIRRRVQAGEHQTDLAVEFGVNRKTLRRRLDALEAFERERAARIADKRLRRQAAGEKRKLFERQRDAAGLAASERSSNGPRAQTRRRVRNPYFDWLDRPKNLSARALSEAHGLVRVRLPDGSVRRWVEAEDVEAFLDDGWLLDHTPRSTRQLR
jgi:hypothetical protein